MTALPSLPFGALLRHFRVAAGLTQEELAEQARMSRRGLQDLERGLRQRPRRETVALLAAALELSAADQAAFLAAARAASVPIARPLPAAMPPMSAAAAPPLIGRAGELALLDRFLQGTDERTASVLLLAGEPGIGKTRLLRAVAQHAAALGWRVLAGGCLRRGGEDPYAPLLDALLRHGNAQPPGRLRAELAGCGWLVRILPGLAPLLELPAADALPPEQERRLITAAVARFLENVAGPKGTLLILDDLQWAGPDALTLLNALANPPRAPLRIVGAYRDNEVQAADPLGVLVADLAQAGLVRHHAVGPLAPEDAVALFDRLLSGEQAGSPALVARVLERGAGVPFFLVSLAHELQVDQVHPIPWDVAQSVRQRVALLPETAHTVVSAAAVVGRRAPIMLLHAVTAQPEEQVLAGLEAACRARLLMEEGEDAYVFVHDLIREVVETDLGSARRMMLHRRVAETLEGSHGGTSPELLAYHYARGGIPDKAGEYLERAGDHAWGQRAHGAAEGYYHEAIERLERLGRVQDAARVREKLGEVLDVAGRYAAALEILERAAETYAVGGDLEGQARVTAAMGRTHRFRGTARAGIALIEALLERLARGGDSPPSLARLYQALSWLLFTVGQYDASLSAGERAATLARACGDDRTLALTEEHRINLLQLLGRLTDALRVGQEVLPLADRIGDPTCLVGTHCDLAYIHALQGAFAAARSSLDRALAWTEQEGNLARLAFTLALRGWIAVLRGEWRDARADLDQAASVLSQTGRSWYSVYLPIFQARLALAEGAWMAASAALQEALVLPETSGDLQALRWAAATMAEIEILEGRAEAARNRLAPLLDRPGLEECDVTMLLPVLAWAQLELGQVDEAAETVEQALARARPEAMRLVLVEALRVRALVALRGEQWEIAAHSLDEGLALARAMPYPYAEARLLHLCSLLHARIGEPEVARERLEAVRTIFARLGARLDTARVERTLSALPQ